MFLEQDGGQLVHEKREANTPVDEMAKRAREDWRSYYGIECILSPSPVCTKLIMLDRCLGQNFLNGANNEAVTSNRAMPIS